jgi:heptosyltransferase-1
MKILFVKTSSMGDVIHALPAIVDAKRHRPDLQIDWVVEEAYALIPRWLPQVDRVIPVAFRRWRKNPLGFLFNKEFRAFWRTLRSQKYDLIIDGQGLLKSAVMARIAKGPIHGFDKKSSREGMSAIFYKTTSNIPFKTHAVYRLRKIFSEALAYPMPEGNPNFGLDQRNIFPNINFHNAIVLLPGTTWVNKHWPESYWQELIRLLHAQNISVKIIWGTAQERERAFRLKQELSNVEVAPDLKIEGVAKLIAGAKAVVAVDTGFAHLANAFNIPMIAMFGPTSPEFNGPVGERQMILNAEFPCAPCLKRRCEFRGEASVSPACFSTISPTKVWDALMTLGGDQ